jgi:hypothetical protein
MLVTYTSIAMYFSKYFSSFSSLDFKPPQLRQYCHYHSPTTTIRTAMISSVDWYHSHPATATLDVTLVTYTSIANIFHFFLIFPRLTLQHHNSANTATTTL